MKLVHLSRLMVCGSLISVAACGGDSSESTDTGGSNTGGTTGGNATTGSGSGSAGNNGGSSPDFKVFPIAIYAGFDDNAHTYQAPVIAVTLDGVPLEDGSVTWSLSDPSFGDLDAEDDGLMITTKKAGDTMLTATRGGASVSVPLHVYQYSAEAYAEGEHRYNNEVDDDNPACSTCHGKGPDLGPDHTQTELDADPDDEVSITFVTGVDPEGRPIAEESEWADLLEGKPHKWAVTESEKTSLLAYMRALEPTGYPEYDAPTEEKEQE